MCVRLWLLTRYTPVIGLTLLLMACSSAENNQVGFLNDLAGNPQIADATKGTDILVLPLKIVLDPKSGIYESTLKISFEHEANVSIYYAFNSKEDFLDLTASDITKHDGAVIELKNQHGVINAVAIDSSGARSRVLSVPFKYLNPDEEIWLEDLFDWPGLTEEEKNKKALMDYLSTYFSYAGEDRDDMLQIALTALVMRGEHVLPDIEIALQNLPPTQEIVRKALVEGLENIAKFLAQGTDPGMIAGRQKTQDLLLSLLKMADIPISADEFSSLPVSLQGGIVERDGQHIQTHSLSKQAVLNAFWMIRDDLAKTALAQISQSPDLYTPEISQAAEMLLSLLNRNFGGQDE